REFFRIADVDRSSKIVWRPHHPHHGLDQIIDVAEAPRLHTIAVDSDVLTSERLYDEIRNHSPIMLLHAPPRGIENPPHFDSKAMLTPIVEEQCLGAPLALIVARPRAHGINPAPIAFGLRMHLRVAIDLRG